jgi:hypothetical protein
LLAQQAAALKPVTVNSLNNHAWLDFGDDDRHWNGHGPLG